MMKATAWFFPVLLTLLCATRLVCTAQRGGGSGGSFGNGYPLDYLDVQAIQDDYLLAKRNKPSLSIVNPLDVLRQRLLLEIARRQMKENTRQVELNRAILKNVGKRVFLGSMTSSHQQQQEQAALLEQQRQRQRQQQLQQQHFPSQLWSYAVEQPPLRAPTSFSPRFFDFLQQQRHESLRKDEAEAEAGNQQMFEDGKKSHNVVVGLTGNDVANETSHKNGERKAIKAGKSVTKQPTADAEDMLVDNELDNNNNNNNNNLGWTADSEEQNDMAELLDNDADNANDGHLPWRYFYRLHNKHYAN